MGGGGATANNELVFNDTSEFIYRNSSEKAAGFTFEAGFLNESRNRDTNLNETEDRTVDALDAACRTQIKNMVNILEADTVHHEDDRAGLVDKSLKAWDRACDLYPEFAAQLGTQLDDIKTEFANRICQREIQWARIAGSSLNCLVADMKMKSETELARRVGGVLAESLVQFRAQETQAIQQAFQMEFVSHYETVKIGFGQLGNLLSILKGAQTVDGRVRAVDEGVNESVNQVRGMGNYFRNAKSIADNQGQYGGDVDDLAAAANAVAGT